MKILVSILFSGFFLFLAFKNIDLGSFWISLQSTSWFLIFFASAMAIVSMWLRAWRWQKILKPLKPIPLNTVFNFTMIGFMGNNVLPAHAGDFGKPYLLGIKENFDGTAALATVLIERLLDSVGMIIILLSVVFFAPLPAWLKFALVAAGSIMLLLIFLLITLASRNSKLRESLLNLTAKLPRKFRTKAKEKVSIFLTGLNIFKNRQNLLPLVGISILTWAHMAFTFFIIMINYPLTIDIGAFDLMVAAVVTMVILAFAIILPSAPGYVGITQLAFIFSLAFYGISEADAVGISIIFHLTQYIPITAGGILILLKEGLSFKQLQGEVRKVEF